MVIFHCHVSFPGVKGVAIVVHPSNSNQAVELISPFRIRVEVFGARDTSKTLSKFKCAPTFCCTWKIGAVALRCPYCNLHGHFIHFPLKWLMMGGIQTHVYHRERWHVEEFGARQPIAPSWVLCCYWEGLPVEVFWSEVELPSLKLT